ncbi:MAG: hypothetical protein ACJAYB_001534 [Psychromonas sp.]|jgi:hypothetical protein
MSRWEIHTHSLKYYTALQSVNFSILRNLIGLKISVESSIAEVVIKNKNTLRDNNHEKKIRTYYHSAA